MATTISQAFLQYALNLEITDRQTSLVSERWKNVVNAVAQEFTLYPTSPSKLIGSYDRNTLIRYLSEGDVDVMVVLHYGDNQAWHNPEGTIKALDKFRTILDKAYPNTEKGRDRNCITMRFTEFRLDVVPAFANESGYYLIPDSIRTLWVSTDPFSFAERITTVNEAMGDCFVPLIKMIKGWNRNEGWPLRSFHLECLLYNHFKNYTVSYSYPYMIKEFFASLPVYLASYTYDPVKGDQVDSYLDNYAANTKRQIAIEKANKAAAKSKEAYEDQDKYVSVAISEWKDLMGEFFPTYG